MTLAAWDPAVPFFFSYDFFSVSVRVRTQGDSAVATLSSIIRETTNVSPAPGGLKAFEAMVETWSCS